MQIKTGAEVTAEAHRRITEKDQELKNIRDENKGLKEELEKKKLLKQKAEEKLHEYKDAHRKMAAQFL